MDQPTCISCDYEPEDLIRRLGNKMELQQICFTHHLLKETSACETCGSVVNLRWDKLTFRCDRRTNIKSHNNKRIMQLRCRYFRSARNRTWFGKSHLPIEDILKITCLWLTPGRSVKKVQEEVRVGRATVNEWFAFCREVAVYHCDGMKEKVGGKGKIVEIDEAKFGKWKYNRGRVIEGQWVIGGVERGSRKLFIVPIKEKTEKTLVSVLKEWVLPGTTIHTDCASSYNNLSKANYKQLTVKHSLKIVDPLTVADSHNFDCLWRDSAELERFSRNKYLFIGYLAESLFKRAFPYFGSRFHQFLLDIANLYTQDQEVEMQRKPPKLKTANIIKKISRKESRQARTKRLIMEYVQHRKNSVKIPADGGKQVLGMTIREETMDSDEEMKGQILKYDPVVKEEIDSDENLSDENSNLEEYQRKVNMDIILCMKEEIEDQDICVKIEIQDSDLNVKEEMPDSYAD
ncbi:uncharacterized protein LOC121875275 [Homarus americanus]|uniref:uncharacterized protein LOC121875275 n=1 Tax=Homarus americanus TaxID=6706 RepID=UPI001C46A24A|nr:uncharacterized protein LOC121875275 [Homarus americanus]